MAGLNLAQQLSEKCTVKMVVVSVYSILLILVFKRYGSKVLSHDLVDHLSNLTLLEPVCAREGKEMKNTDIEIKMNFMLKI